MNNVYSEKRGIGQAEISDQDIISFLHSKEEIAKWTDNNFVRVKNTYKAILCEAGLVIKDGASLKILKPIIDDLLVVAFPAADEYTAAMGLEI